MSVNEDNMNPAASPTEQSKSGVRKVNNMPLFLLTGVVGGFLLIMMLVAIDRASSQDNSTEQTALATVSPASNLAKDIIGQNEDGIIEPDGYVPGVIDKSQEIPQPNLEPDFNHYSSNQQADLNAINSNEETLNKSDKTGAALTEDDLLRIQITRMQLLEQAIKAKPTVAGFRVSDASGGGGFTGSPQNQLAEIRRQLASTKTGASDPNKVYKAKLEQLKGMMSGVGGGSIAMDNFGASDQGDSEDNMQTIRQGSWVLNSTLDAPTTPFVLRAGFVIPGLMISGINSELPGQIMAQVSEDVYDTATGNYILIPQGSRLVGAYSSQVAYGQSRVLVAWDRIVFPDGKALDIGGMKGADSAGYAGYKDKVNTHFMRVFSTAFLMSGIVAGVNLSQDAGGGDALNDRQRASDAMSEALGQQLGQAMTQMIMKNLNIAPTLEIRPGYRFNIMVSKDMVFDRPYESFDY